MKQIHYREANTNIPNYLAEKDIPTPTEDILSGYIQVLPTAQAAPSENNQEGWLPAILWGEHLFLGGFWVTYTGTTHYNVVLEGIGTRIVGPAVTKTRTIKEKAYFLSTSREGVISYRYGDVEIPYAFVPVEVTFGEAVQAIDLACMQPVCGTACLDPAGGPEITVTSDFYGLVRTWKESLKLEKTKARYTSPPDPLFLIQSHVKNATLTESADVLWERFFQHNPQVLALGETPDKGLTNAYRKAAPYLEQLKKEAPLEWCFFQWLRDPRTKDKYSNNGLLAAFLNNCTGYDDLQGALRKARTETFLQQSIPNFLYWDPRDLTDTWFNLRRGICLTLPGAVEKVTAIEAKTDWTKQAGAAKQSDALGLTEQYPLLRKAVVEGKIPTSVFHQPNKAAVNQEFSIWEKALVRKGWAEVLYKIAQDAARHSTYEKDITPYLAFMFRLERYLDRHAPAPKKLKGWACMPKYVESQWDLEMEDPDENGTVKRRSAMTPVADNDTRIVTVPFVALSVGGARTQWCYSRHYHLFEEGFTDPVSGGIVPEDLEQKLNGRDDYGLCYYTLTGTETARGYPTFLIIFERLSAKTRVHFHRVHPCRTKDGLKTPACRLVQACYQYMAGNVPASDIVAQQGDLMFIRTSDPIASGAKVGEKQTATSISFESHTMSSQDGVAKIELYDSLAKQPANRLGYLYAAGQMRVTHPEHEHLQGMDSGWYEIRRAKSYENNPKAQWSLSID